MIQAFAALAEPNRFRIVELLLTGALSVNEIGERLALNQPQVSKHLRVLKETGMVDVEPRAQQRLYELRAQPLRQMHDWLERYRKVWDERFEALDDLLVEMQAPEARRTKAEQQAKAASHKEPRHERNQKRNNRK